MAHDDDQVADGPSSPRRMLRQYAAQAEGVHGAGAANVSGYEPCLSKGHILNGLGRFLRAQVSGWYSLPGAGRHNADSLAALLIPSAAASLNAATANHAPNSPRITSANAAAAAAEASQNALDAAAAAVRSTLVPASEELFLPANQTSAQAREAMEKMMASTLNLFIELTSVWLVVLRERIARCTPPSLASAKQAATLDAREIEATLVSWLSAEQSSVRWDIFRALRGLRALEQALQPHVARVSACLDLDEELPVESPDADRRRSPGSKPLRVCFIDVMERCTCLTKGIDLTGDSVLSNTGCKACVVPDASGRSEAQREIDEQQSLLEVEIDPCQDVPLHLVDASNLRQEGWSVYYAHLLRALLLHAAAEVDPATSLASRLHVRAEERLHTLQRKLDEITGVRAYWKKRLAWSITAAFAKATSSRPARTLPRRGEEALSDEEHACWRNLLILSGISYSALQMHGPATIPAQKSYFLSRFVSLLGNNHEMVRRSAILALGNLDLAVPDLDTAPAATPTSLVTSLVDASGSGSVVSTVSVPIVAHTPRLGIAAPLLAVLTEIQERMRGAPAGTGASTAAAPSASSPAASTASASASGADGACHVFLPSSCLCATPGSDFPHSHLAHDLDSETLVATHTEPTPVALSAEEVDRLRIDLSVVYKLLIAQMESWHLLLPSAKVQASHPLQAQTHSIVLLIRSYVLTYILGAYALVTKSHPHNEFRWDFIDLRCNLARIIARVARITTEEAELETDVGAASTSDDSIDQPTPTTPLLSDPQRKLLFEMLLAWCGHGPSSAAYAEKFKAHSAELLAKIDEKARKGRKKRRSSGSAAAAANQALKAQLTVLVEQLKILSLQGMAALLRGKCFDPHLQAQLHACSSGAGWDMLSGGSSASSSSSSVSYGQAHDPSFAAASDHKGTVFPWLNSLLVSPRPTERDIAYTALESFILHNEHLLYQFITSCYVVQAGSSVISKRYFQTIGHILWKQAMAIRERERERTKALAEGRAPPTYTGAPPRMLKLPLSVLLHLLIFKLGDLSFSVRAMALRLIPVMDHFYGAERARITSAAQAAAANPRRNKGAGATVPPPPPLQVVVGSHLPDTFRAMQLQLSAHFASVYPSESLSVFNECGRRVMFLHSLRMGAAAGSPSAGSAASFSLHSIGAGGNSVHINNQIEDNIKNMMAYLAPWLAHIQLAPPSLLSIAQNTFAYANSAAGEMPVSPMIGRNNRSLRTYSVLTAKKGPLEVMHQLLDFTFLFSASIIPPSAAGNAAAAQAAASASASGADASSAGNTGSTLSIHTAPAPYSVPSSLLQGLFTHLVRGHADADHAHGCSSDSDSDDDDEHDAPPNSNLEHLVLFLFDRMTLAQSKGRLTPEWMVCFQRVALYLSRIEPDQTLRCIIGQMMASTPAAAVAAAGEAKSLAVQSGSASKAVLTKANFAMMLLVEIAYELDLGGDEMTEPAAAAASSASSSSAAKASSSSSSSSSAQKKPPSVAEQKYPSRGELSVPSPSSHRTSGGGKRRSAGRGGSFGGLKAPGTSIRVRQPLETVALLLHIGLLGLHYPASSSVSASTPEAQAHVSNFVRRHATSLLINLIQATVFHTSEQLHPEKLRVRNPDRGFVPAAGVAPGPARSMLFMHQADVCAAHVDSDWEGEDAGSDDDFPLGSAVLSSASTAAAFASSPLSASSRHFAQSNSKHTLNLALAPLQLAPPPKDVLAAAVESKEESENNDGAGGSGSGAQSAASRAQVRESNALKLINDLNQYLGWILCQRSSADGVTNSQPRVPRGLDSDAPLDSCPVPGLDFQSLLPNLLRIMPARIRLRAPLLQKWWRLTAEWSNKCTNDAHCRAGSLRLMQLMACSILPPEVGAPLNRPPAKPAVELKDLLSLMDRAESDLGPWISNRDDESKNVAPAVLPPLSSASAAPFVLAQNLSTIQSVLFALVARDRAQGFVTKSAKTLYSSALPRLFCLCVQTVVSQSTLNDAELLKPRPKLAGTIVLQALEFLAGMVELVAAQSSEGGHRAKLPRSQRGNPDVEPLPSAKQLVQHIGLFYLESSNNGSSSSAARNKHPFPSLLILIQQLLKANVPVTAVSSIDQPAGSGAAAAGSAASPDRSGTLVLFTKDIDSAACAQNSRLLARAWAVLARLAPFSLVNDEDRTVVAPLIDFGFVAQQQQMKISPALAPDSETLLHPFLLNIALQLPSWCLSLRAPPAVSPAWHLVAAFAAEPPSPPLLLPAQEDLARKAGKALGEIALAFGLGHLSSLLRQFGAGEFHRASAMHAALHGASAPHAQFLVEIAPLLVECVSLTVAPKLMHVLLDCIVSVSTWLPTPAKPSAAPAITGDGHSTPAPKKKKVKQGGLARLFSSNKKRRSSGEKRAAAAEAAAASVTSAATAAPTPFVSQFHLQTQLVLFELICALLTRVQWPQVEAQAAAASKASVASASSAAAEAKASADAAAGGAVATSEEVHAVFARFEALAVWPDLAAKVHATLRLFAPGAAATSPLAHARSRAHSQAYLLVAQPGSNAVGHHPPPRLPLQPVQAQVQAVPFPSLSAQQTESPPVKHTRKRSSLRSQQQQQPQPQQASSPSHQHHRGSSQLFSSPPGPPLSPTGAGASGRKSVGFSRDVQVNGSGAAPSRLSSSPRHHAHGSSSGAYMHPSLLASSPSRRSLFADPSTVPELGELERGGSSSHSNSSTYTYSVAVSPPRDHRHQYASRDEEKENIQQHINGQFLMLDQDAAASHNEEHQQHHEEDQENQHQHQQHDESEAHEERDVHVQGTPRRTSHQVTTQMQRTPPAQLQQVPLMQPQRSPRRSAAASAALDLLSARSLAQHDAIDVHASRSLHGTSGSRGSGGSSTGSTARGSLTLTGGSVGLGGTAGTGSASQFGSANSDLAARMIEETAARKASVQQARRDRFNERWKKLKPETEAAAAMAGAMNSAAAAHPAGASSVSSLASSRLGEMRNALGGASQRKK